MVLRKAYRRRKGNSTPKLVAALAVLIVIGLGFYSWRARRAAGESAIQNPAASATSSLASTTPALWATLRDRDGVFEVKYPRGVFKRADKQAKAPLKSEDKVSEIVLAHMIPVRHCGPSGLPEHCTPTTTDMAVSFFTVDRNFNDVHKEISANFGEGVEVRTIDGHQGIAYQSGAEGEGIYYVVLPVDNARTLFIGRSYIDEGVASFYRKAPGFIPHAEQKAAFERMLGAFKFRPSI